MGEKKSLQWIYYPTDHWVCLFVRFTDRLANFRSQDWKIFGQAPYRDDYGLVQPVGPRLIQSWLFTVLYFSFKWLCSKFSCKLLSPNSRNESRPCDVFSELLVFYTTNILTNRLLWRRLKRQERVQLITVYSQIDCIWTLSIYSIKMCFSRRSRGFIMMQKDKSWKLDWFTTKRTFSLEEKTRKQNKSQYMPHWHQLNIK